MATAIIGITRGVEGQWGGNNNSWGGGGALNLLWDEYGYFLDPHIFEEADQYSYISLFVVCKQTILRYRKTLNTSKCMNERMNNPTPCKHYIWVIQR